MDAWDGRCCMEALSKRRGWPEVFCATAQMKGGQAVEGGGRVLGAPHLDNSHRSHALEQIRGVRGEANPPGSDYVACLAVGLPCPMHF